MKSILFFATTALAATQTFKVSKRQASVISNAIASVSSSVSALNAAVSSFNSADQVGALESAASDTITQINNANSAISPISMLSDPDALPLASPITDLASLVEAATQNVISKKSTFDGLGVGGVVLSTLNQLSSGANTLSSTILSKIPSDLQTIGNMLAGRITTALNNAVQAYQGESSSGGSTSGGSSATSAASSAATSAASSAATSAASSAATTSRAATTTAAAGTSTTRSASASASSAVSAYHGAGVNNAAQGYGAAAMAALAVAAMF